MSPICDLLKKPGFLCEGLITFGDNSYINTPYITSPFKVVSSGPKDAYNHYHYQMRIKIECAFGMLVNRWAVLQTPIPIHILIVKKHVWYVLYAIYIIG